jgi:transposase
MEVPMPGKRYTEEFKIEAVKQLTEGGYAVSDVAHRLGVTTKSLYDWKAKYGKSSADYQSEKAAQDELRRLKAELKRVTQERDILKGAECFSQGSQRTLRVHKISPASVSGEIDVQGT